MRLEANVDGHYVAAAIPAGAYMDAGRADDLAGLEVQIEGDVRVGVNERSAQTSHLSLTSDVDTMRSLAVELAVKLGLPAFTEREWHTIATGLLLAATRAETDEAQAEYERFADRIAGAYS